MIKAFAIHSALAMVNRDMTRYRVVVLSFDFGFAHEYPVALRQR